MKDSFFFFLEEVAIGFLVGYYYYFLCDMGFFILLLFFLRTWDRLFLIESVGGRGRFSLAKTLFWSLHFEVTVNLVTTF